MHGRGLLVARTLVYEHERIIIWHAAQLCLGTKDVEQPKIAQYGSYSNRVRQPANFQDPALKYRNID